MALALVATLRLCFELKANVNMLTWHANTSIVFFLIIYQDVWVKIEYIIYKHVFIK